MNCHPLVKLAHMLHGICIAIINDEGWLLELPRERSPFNAACERWFRELVQCPTHGIVSQAPRRWASVFAPLITLFHMRENLAWGGSRSLPIVVIVFIIMRRVRARMAWRSFLFKSFISRCMACSLSCLWDT